MESWFTDYAVSRPSEALVWESTLLSFTQKFKNDSLLAITHNYLGVLYRNNSMLDSGLAHQVRSVSYSFAAEDTIYWIKTLGNLASCYQEMNLYTAATEANYKAIQLADIKKDTVRSIILHFNLGALHIITQNIPAGRRTLETALDLSTGSGNLQFIPDILLGLAAIEHEEGNYLVARSYWSRVLEFAERAENPRLISMALSNMAVTEQELQNWDTAAIILRRAYKIDQEIGNPLFIANSSLNLGSALIQVGKPEEAKPYLEESMAIYGEEGVATQQPGVYRLLSTTMRDLGEWESAYHYALTWKSLSDSMIGIDYKLEVSKLEQRYQNEKDALKIAEMERDGERDRSRYGITLLALIGGIGILLALLGLLVLIQRKRQSEQKRRSLELEHKLLQAQMNPHFLFNSLNTLRHFHLQKEFDKADEYLVQFSQMLRGVLENSNQTLVSLEEELDTLKDYISIEQMRFDKTFSFDIQVDPGIVKELVMVPPLVLQPFVENAIVHGILPCDREGSLEISIHPDGDKHLRCLIRDNGVGIQVSQKSKEGKKKHHKSHGIQITRDRLGGPDRVAIREMVSEGGAVMGTEVEIMLDLNHFNSN